MAKKRLKGVKAELVRSGPAFWPKYWQGQACLMLSRYSVTVRTKLYEYKTDAVNAAEAAAKKLGWKLEWEK